MDLPILDDSMRQGLAYARDQAEFCFARLIDINPGYSPRTGVGFGLLAGKAILSRLDWKLNREIVGQTQVGMGGDGIIDFNEREQQTKAGGKLGWRSGKAAA